MKTPELKNQMELTLEIRVHNRNRRSKKPSRRSGWWFTQMRQVVDRAMDWTPRPTPRVQQVSLFLDRQSQSPNW